MPAAPNTDHMVSKRLGSAPLSYGNVSQPRHVNE
jgi:hypothetical protein